MPFLCAKYLHNIARRGDRCRCRRRRHCQPQAKRAPNEPSKHACKERNIHTQLLSADSTSFSASQVLEAGQGCGRSATLANRTRAGGQEHCPSPLTTGRANEKSSKAGRTVVIRRGPVVTFLFWSSLLCSLDSGSTRLGPSLPSGPFAAAPVVYVSRRQRQTFRAWPSLGGCIPSTHPRLFPKRAALLPRTLFPFHYK